MEDKAEHTCIKIVVVDDMATQETRASADMVLTLPSRINIVSTTERTLIAKFTGSTWGPPGADRTQVVPMLAHELSRQSGKLFLAYCFLITAKSSQVPIRQQIIT